MFGGLAFGIARNHTLEEHGESEFDSAFRCHVGWEGNYHKGGSPILLIATGGLGMR